MPRASRSSKSARVPAAAGLGLDIVEISRISEVARSNKRFLTRVFSKEEILYCAGKKKKWQHFAVRFAAKEAVWKALGVPGLRLRDISIRRAISGRPGVVLEGKPAAHIQVSLSHSDNYAAAVAICGAAPPSRGRRVRAGKNR